MYFCVEGLNVKTGNCINISKYFDNRLLNLKTLKKILKFEVYYKLLSFSKLGTWRFLQLSVL